MAETAKKEVQVSLETVLWNCRVALRGVGSTEKDRDAVIALVFLKFAGDKFEKRRSELIEQYGDIPAFLEKASFYNAVNVFYLKETARWSYIVKNAPANDIAVIIDQAMADIEDSNPPLKGALPLNLFATLGADKFKIKDLIDNVNQITEERFREEDLIGRVYEYFLQVYAALGTKEDGEFYTPACVVKLIAEMKEPYSGVVYDPCCGSGGMFVQSLKFVDRHNSNKRNEFYREVRFRNFGSQRPKFNFNDMSEIIMPLPSLSVQQKYVDIYNSMLANQRCYERGLEDLKLVCDAYIENLKKKHTTEPIGRYITRHDVRNGANGTKNVMSISTSKKFRMPTSKVNKNELSNYKVVKPRQIGFVQTTHNEKVFAFAFNDTDSDIIISSVNEVFSTDENYLLPEYLSIFFNRKGFDRYARFHSWGSARETFTWNDLQLVEIPIVSISIQKAISDIYKVYSKRVEINKTLKAQINDLCPILIKGSLEEEI